MPIIELEYYNPSTPIMTYDCVIFFEYFQDWDINFICTVGRVSYVNISIQIVSETEYYL